MKKIIYTAFIVATIALVSCSKDKKINKRIDGSWKVTLYEGEALEANESITYDFSKSDKTEGTGTLTLTDASGNNFVQDFTYSIEDEKFNMTTNSIIFGERTRVY